MILPLSLPLVRLHLECRAQFGLPSTTKTWMYWNESTGGHEAGQGAGAQDLPGEAERAASVQPGKEKAQETFWLSTTIKLEDTEKTELDS